MIKRILARISAQEGPVPWGIGRAVGAVVASFAAVILCTTITLTLLANTQASMLASWTLAAGLTLVYLIVTLRRAGDVAALRLGSSALKGEIPSKRGQTAPADAPREPNFFFLLLVGVGLAVTMDLIGGRVTGQFLPEPELLRPFSDSVLYGLPVLPLTWVLALVFMVALQPIAEEIVFRGMLLPSLRGWLGPWPGLVATSVAYGLFHLGAFAPAPETFGILWYGLISPMVAGMIFGMVRIYTGSTRAAILTHAAFGLFAVLKLVTVIQ